MKFIGLNSHSNETLFFNAQKLSLGRALIGLQQIWIVLTSVGSGNKIISLSFLENFVFLSLFPLIQQ